MIGKNCLHFGNANIKIKAKKLYKTNGWILQQISRKRWYGNLDLKYRQNYGMFREADS